MVEHFIFPQVEKRKLVFHKRCTAHVGNLLKTAVREKDIDFWMRRCSVRLVESIETLKTKIVAAIETMTSEMLKVLG
jgi:hypothetical protein